MGLTRRRALDAIVRRAAGLPEGYVLRGGVAAWSWWPERPADDVDLVAGPAIPHAACRAHLAGLPAIDGGDGVTVTLAAPPEVIWAETPRPGWRARYAVDLGGDVEIVQLDVGFGDPFDPAPIVAPVPTCSPPSPVMPQVGPEQALSWKAHGLVEHADRLGRSARWRPKDLLDLWVLLGRVAPSPSSLATAFSSRGAPLSLLNRLADGELGRSPASRAGWAEVCAARPEVGAPALPEAVAQVAARLAPALEVLRPAPAPFGRFPRIAGRDEVLAAVGGLAGIVVHPRGALTVINAETNDDWPDPAEATTLRSRWDRAVLRECRGLVFDADGALVSRPYPKFFRLGERPETMPSPLAARVARSRPRALEKLDGAMITVGRVGDTIVWFSRRGPSAFADAARDTLDPALHAVVARWVDEGWTPIFEYCARGHRIVIDHPTPRVVLTALRRRDDGTLLDHDALVAVAAGFDLPRDHGRVADLAALVDEVRASRGEGVVLRFDDGEMVKIKSDFYDRLHRVVEATEPDRAVAEAIVWGELDDLIERLPDQAAAFRARAAGIEASILREAAWLDATLAERERIRALPREARGPALEALLRGSAPERGLCLRSAAPGEDAVAVVRRVARDVARTRGLRRWLA